MGVSGRTAKTFTEANLAMCTGLHLDGGYPHCTFDVIESPPGGVVLKSHSNGEEFHRKVLKRTNGQEFVTIVQQSTIAKAFDMEGEEFQVLPFVGSRF